MTDRPLQNGHGRRRAERTDYHGPHCGSSDVCRAGRRPGLSATAAPSSESRDADSTTAGSQQTRRRLLQSAGVAGSVLLAGCRDFDTPDEGLGLPTLERAWFRLDQKGDIRFRLEYDGAVGDVADGLDGNQLFDNSRRSSAGPPPMKIV